MRVAIGPYGGGSGISTYTSELCKALSSFRSDIDITLLTWQGSKPPNEGIPTVTIPRGSFLNMSDYGGGPLIKGLVATREIRRRVKYFDLVHLPDSTYGAFVRHPRLVLTSWGYYTWRLIPQWYLDRFGFPFNLPATAAGIQFQAMNTIARRFAKAIISLLPLSCLPMEHVSQNTFYVPPALAFRSTAVTEGENRRKPSTPVEDSSVVMIFGSRDLSIKGKGAQLAVDAFSKLVLRHKTKATLLMVGGHRGRIAVPSNVRDSVVFTGFLDRNEYLELLGPGRCFLALSHGEELDYGCLEAMAAGCAVIVSDIPAHYMVRDHETGRVVSRNSDSICSAMLDLADEDIRGKLGKNAAREVKLLTKPDEVARKYLTIYKKMLFA